MRSRSQISRGPAALEPHAPPEGKSLDLRMMVVLGVLAAGLYANTFANRFAIDDLMVIQINKFTRQGLAGIPTILTTPYWAGAWSRNIGVYRPLSLVGLAAQWQFFGDVPTGYHIVSVLLYVLTILLLFLTLRALLSGHSPFVAFVTALIFRHRSPVLENPSGSAYLTTGLANYS